MDALSSVPAAVAATEAAASAPEVGVDAEYTPEAGVDGEYMPEACGDAEYMFVRMGARFARRRSIPSCRGLPVTAVLATTAVAEEDGKSAAAV